MSKRLIDANELISAMYYYEHNEGGLTAYDAQDIINKAPTIEPKRGEWIRDASSPIAYRCTACNTLQHWSAIQDGRYHYCPNCGALMREREGE